MCMMISMTASMRMANMTANEKDIEAISHGLPCLCDYRYRFADNAGQKVPSVSVSLKK